MFEYPLYPSIRTNQKHLYDQLHHSQFHPGPPFLFLRSVRRHVDPIEALNLSPAPKLRSGIPGSSGRYFTAIISWSVIFIDGYSAMVPNTPPPDETPGSFQGTSYVRIMVLAVGQGNIQLWDFLFFFRAYKGRCVASFICIVYKWLNGLTVVFCSLEIDCWSL